jgi:hypothetical protein
VRQCLRLFQRATLKNTYQASNFSTIKVRVDSVSATAGSLRV